MTLPHDAMQLDERSETSAGGVNIGWYEAQDYTYEKTFILPEKAKDEKVILEFEGVYRKATVSQSLFSTRILPNKKQAAIF